MDAPVAAVPVVAGIDVGDAGVVEISHVNGSVRSDGAMHRTEPLVPGLHRVFLFHRPEGAAVWFHPQGVDLVAERVGPDQASLQARDRTTAVANPLVYEAGLLSLDRHAEEMPEGVGVGVGPVFAEAFLIVAALHEMDGLLSAVGSRVEPPLVVEIDAEVVPAALGEKLKDMAGRMVAPDVLPEEGMPRRVLVEMYPDAGGYRATSTSVEPAVGSEFETVGNRVGVLKVEPGEVHHRLAVGNVVPVLVGIEEKVGRVKHPHAILTVGQGGDHVELVKERFVHVEGAVAVRVLVDGDFVLPDELPVQGFSEGRGWRDLVEDLAEVLVPGEDLETGGIGILDILDHPEPPAFIEVKIEGLPDQRFAEDRFDHQVRADLELSEGLVRGSGIALVVGTGIGIVVALEVFGHGCQHAPAPAFVRRNYATMPRALRARALNERLHLGFRVSAPLRPGRNVAASEEPVAAQINGIIHARQVNGPLEDSAPAALVEETPGNEVGFAKADLVRFDDEGPTDAARGSAEEGRHGSVGANLGSVEEPFVHIADRIHHQEEAATLPPCGYVHAGTVPPEPFLALPALRMRDREGRPVLELGQGRSNGQQTE